MPVINRWRGDAQGRAQVDRIRVTDPEIGDTFTVTCNRKDVSYTVEDPGDSGFTLEHMVYDGLRQLFGENSDIEEFKEMTAALEYADETNTPPATGLLIFGPSNGKPFTITVSSADVGDLGIIVEEIVKGVAAVNEVQTVTLESVVNGGTFTLTFDGQTTANIAWNAAAATVQTALENLSNIAVGDVAVTGNAGGPWAVEFKGAFATANVPDMTANGALLTIAGGYTVDAATLTQGATGLNEKQIINIGNPTSGTYTLTFAGQTTAAIAFNASAATIQTALEALSNIAPGDVTVTEIANASGRRFQVEFKGVYRNTDVPTIVGNGSGLDGWATVSVSTVTQGEPARNSAFVFELDGAYQSAGIAVRVYDFRFPFTSTEYEVTIYEVTSSVGFPAEVDALVGKVYSSGGTFLRNIGAGGLRYTGSNGNRHGFELAGPWSGVPAYDNQAQGQEFEELSVDLCFSTGNTQETFGAASFDDEYIGGSPPGDLDGDHAGNGSATNEVQKVTLLRGPTGGTFTLTFQGQTTAGIAYNATAGNVQTALEALSNIAPGDVVVTGNAGGPWTITFQGAWAGTDLEQMTANEAGLTGNAILVNTSQTATPYTNEVQRITLLGSPAGGTFTLSFNGLTTAAIAYNASAATLEGAMELAFGNGFTVTGDAGGPWRIEFTDTFKGANQAQLTGNGALLSGSKPDVATTREAVQPVNEQQTITLDGGPGAGTFTLTYAGQTTAAIPYNASSAVLKNALVALSNIGPTDIAVSGVAGGPWTVTFRDALAATDVVEITGDGSGLSPGGGAQTITLEHLVIPTGPNWVNEAENWSLNHVLADGEWGVAEDNDRDMLYGLDQMAAVTPAKMIFKGTYTGAVGLPDDNGLYIEYRPRKLRLGTAADAITMTIEVGAGGGEGPSRLRLDTGDCPTILDCKSTGTPENGEPAALDWVGTAATNKVRLYKTAARIAALAGETATIAELLVAFVDNADSDVSLLIGDGVTLTAVTKAGGQLTCFSNLPAFEQLAGVTSLGGFASATSPKIRGGTLYYDADGQLAGNAILSGDGKLDFSRDGRAKTIVNPIEVFGDTADVNDPFKVCNPAGNFVIDYNETTRAPNLGRNYRITRAAVA